MTPADYAAIYTGQMGLHLVPLPPRSKIPTTQDWGNHLLTDADEARDYYARNPAANMGVALGPSRICSLDIDDLDATRLIFDEFGWSLDDLLDYAPTIQGKPGGMRLMFRVPDGQTLKYHALSWTKRNGEAGRFSVLELRAADTEHRQDVLPPSIHPVTEQPYIWLRKPQRDVCFPDPPEWLLQLWANWDALKPQLQSVCPWAQPVRHVHVRQPRQTDGASVIDAYNAAHSITDALARYGYVQRGKRWLSPSSTTGLPGVAVFAEDNRAFIHHASDPLCSTERNQPVAPFDLFREYEHNGDYTAATRAASAELGMRSAPRPAPAAPSGPVDTETGEIMPDATPAAARYSDYHQLPEPPAPRFQEPIDLLRISAPPKLPIECLPDPIIEYVVDQAQLLGCDHGIIGMTALVSAAACITDDIKLQPKRHDPTWRESARLWLAIVGDPSTRKSPAIAKAVRHVKRIDGDMAEQNAREQGQHKAQTEEWKELNKEAKKTGTPLPAPEKPALRRLLVEDTTVEALSEILKDNPRGVLCLKDELTGWFASMDAYKGASKGASMDRAHWLEAYNGGRRSIDRITRGNVVVPNWSVCMIGGIQEEMIRRVANTMGHDGLLQRFMVVCASAAEPDQDRCPDMRAMDRYKQLFDQLQGLQGCQEPVTMEEAAHQCRERVAQYARQMIDVFDHPHMRAWLGKWDGLFARLVLLYHIIECASREMYPTDTQVSGRTASRVERLMCGFLLRHAIHFYTNVLDANDQTTHTKQLARLILARGFERITRRDMARLWHAGASLDEFEVGKIISMLVNHSWLDPDPSSIKGDGRPRAWIVNPRVHVAFANYRTQEVERREKVRGLMEQLRGEDEPPEDDY